MVRKRPEGGDQDLVRVYLDEIGRYPLLSKEDEVVLAQAIEAGREAAAELAAGGSLTVLRTHGTKATLRPPR